MLGEKLKLATSEAARAKMARTKRGKKLSAEIRAKMAAGQAKYWESASPEERAARGVWRGAARPEHGDKLKGKPRRERRSLTFEKAEEIRAAKAVGASYATLEKVFGVNRSSLFNIVKRKTYASP